MFDMYEERLHLDNTGARWTPRFSDRILAKHVSWHIPLATFQRKSEPLASLSKRSKLNGLAGMIVKLSGTNSVYPAVPGYIGTKDDEHSAISTRKQRHCPHRQVGVG